ncbi:hypothetical protein ABMC89_12915 [Sulfitobacter sp. HNIBRBA3233]|uniref:hypothetical protein n=1 Tax=Sulfitobacter marinivivus TaxID=3158558 RepID=UPI0032DE7AA8
MAPLVDASRGIYVFVLRRGQSDPATQTSVHATDNASETAETLQAVFGAGTLAYLETLRGN